MPKIPDIKTLNANSVQIMNAVRNELGGTYAQMVPIAEDSTRSIRTVGEIIMSYDVLYNDFLNALVNRIGRVIITSKLYRNPWADFKRGLLEYGETIEEIFVNIAKPFQFDPATAETEVFKREIPDVRAAFHTMNYQKFYKVTISNDQLRQAFLSWDGITDLIGRIIDSLYTGANYDEFLTMKYMIARMALNGNMHPINIPDVTAANAKSVVTTIKAISNSLEFMSSAYNAAGVATYTDKYDQFIILNAEFDATIDVEVLASAFNMDKAEFMGRRIVVDSFSNLDNARLAELFAEDSGYVEISGDDLTKLSSIPAILVDRDWFMIFDNYYNMTQQYNGQGLYWNYWYHVWKTFSTSPFANAILFTTATPSITSVSITPSTAAVDKGQSIQLSANVVAVGFANKNVTWSISGATASNISPAGLLTVGSGETGSAITVTATSVFDGSKKGTATITVNP